MKQLTFLVKPASSLCGLRCRYCFYEDVAQCRETQSMGIMSHETAEHLLRAAAQAAESGDVIQITFQGGEPTLAGLDFFRDFVAMEGELIPSGVTVNHSIQTNGMAVTAEWAEFFRANRFLVGLSLDGTFTTLCGWTPRARVPGTGRWRPYMNWTRRGWRQTFSVWSLGPWPAALKRCTSL